MGRERPTAGIRQVDHSRGAASLNLPFVASRSISGQVRSARRRKGPVALAPSPANFCVFGVLFENRGRRDNRGNGLGSNHGTKSRLALPSELINLAGRASELLRRIIAAAISAMPLPSDHGHMHGQPGHARTTVGQGHRSGPYWSTCSSIQSIRTSATLMFSLPCMNICVLPLIPTSGSERKVMSPPAALICSISMAQAAAGSLPM